MSKRQQPAPLVQGDLRDFITETAMMELEIYDRLMHLRRSLRGEFNPTGAEEKLEQPDLLPHNQPRQ